MTKTYKNMAEEKTKEHTVEEPLVLDKEYYTPKMIGQLESDKLKAPPIYEDDRNKDTSQAINMKEGGKKVLMAPMAAANSMNDFEKSPWVGKAVGMNMIIGLLVAILSKFLGANMLQSLGWGLGAFTMGQEIRSMAKTTGEVFTGKRGLNDHRAIASIVPMLIAGVVAVLKHNVNWTMGSFLTSAIASRALNNHFYNSDTYYRYYQDDREAVNKDLAGRREQIEKAEREQTITIREDLDEMLSEREMQEHVRQTGNEVDGNTLTPEETKRSQQAVNSQAEDKTNVQSAGVAKRHP